MMSLRSPGLGVQAAPHLTGVDINEASDLLIDHLMFIPDQSHQVTDQKGLFVGDLAVRNDDQPGDPQQQLRVPAPLAQIFGEFDDAGFVSKDGSRVPPGEQRGVAVHDDRERNADQWDADLDDVALQELLADDGESLRGGQDRSGVEVLDHRPHHGRDHLYDALTHCFPALDREGNPDELPQVVGVRRVERDLIKDCDVVSQAELELGYEGDIDHNSRDGGDREVVPGLVELEVVVPRLSPASR